MKTLFLSVVLSLGTIAILFGQDCYVFYSLPLNSQADIDNFRDRFPNCTTMNANIDISGKDISNLNGLSHLDSIKGNLSIQKTSLVSLSGLENLTFIDGKLSIYDNDQLLDVDAMERFQYTRGGFSLFNNNQLSSINGLKNLQFPQIGGYIRISSCPNLNQCNIDNVCNALKNYTYNSIYNNGPDCASREKIVEQCNFEDDNSPKKICFYDDFDFWPTDSFPFGWSEGRYVEQFDKYTCEKAYNPKNQESSLVLNGILFGWDTPAETTLYKSLECNQAVIDIEFTYRTLGSELCSVGIIQSTFDKDGGNYRRIWNTYAGDSTSRTIQLKNIAVNPPFNYISGIFFGTYSTYLSLTQFIIDNVKVSIPQKIEIEPLDFILSPNPTYNYLYVTTETDFESMEIFDYTGKLLLSKAYEDQISTFQLPRGIYLLALKKGEEKIFKRFIKL